MELLIIGFSIACLLLVYVPIAMIAKEPVNRFLSKGIWRRPWARLALLIVVLLILGLVVACSVTPPMKEAWNSILLLCTAALVLLSLVANAPHPSDAERTTDGDGSSFWSVAASINAKSFVGALAAVVGTVSIGLAFV